MDPTIFQWFTKYFVLFGVQSAEDPSFWIEETFAEVFTVRSFEHLTQKLQRLQTHYMCRGYILTVMTIRSSADVATHVNTDRCTEGRFVREWLSNLS
jgi:hypothetical protein